jgi:hypothetical protein
LKSHKTAKALFGKAWTKTRWIWKGLEKCKAGRHYLATSAPPSAPWRRSRTELGQLAETVHRKRALNWSYPVDVGERPAGRRLGAWSAGVAPPTPPSRPTSPTCS